MTSEQRDRYLAALEQEKVGYEQRAAAAKEQKDADAEAKMKARIDAVDREIKRVKGISLTDVEAAETRTDE